MKEAIILAGGLGTRLKSITGDLPKPMATVATKPFLHYLFVQLKRWNIDRVILSVGYNYEIIQNYFGEEYLDISVSYSVEAEPLGTGGAIRQSIEHTTAEEFFILNGDTYFNIAFDSLEQTFNLNKADLAIGLKNIQKSNRYGTVELNEHHRIVEFHEKRHGEEGFINAGVYYTSKSLLRKLPDLQKFSFEEDYLKPFAKRDNIYGLVWDSYFIDIGIPEDYERANKDFATKSF